MSDIVKDTVERLLDRINAISAGGPGFTRPSYSPLESQAHRVIEDEATALGLTVTRDAALNLFARLPGRDRSAPAIHVGSHLDTVAMGGAYDGQAGVAGAMALAAAFVDSGELPPVDLVVTVTRAEESVWFPVSYVGSRAALGRLTAEELQATRSDTGRTLHDHILSEGGRPDDILTDTPLAPARFIELHIEQGTVLHAAHEPYGIVSGVRGGLRYRQARIDGTWAHSGGPARSERSDAVFALADLIVAMDRRWDEALRAGDDLAVTFGRVDAATPEHAFAKVPGRVDFCVDLRSDDVDVLDRMDAVFLADAKAIEAARGVRFALGAQSRSQPTKLSAVLGDQIAEAAVVLGHTPRRMLSGGGHDAAAFAQAGWDSVMVFLRNWNGSHNPDEAMDPADLVAAVKALHGALAGMGETSIR
ncbi:hydantoinase/carbamoylase family amidase [Rhizobium sp. CFBP 13726]|uniref:hydantoinase/carbamoylase family amidase n=1 Tax=Rhizobium sp. CFBP 13726 TaxID=2775296 RepID=UPI001780253D|nr:hydantoinase/carbamoylase family amidase [Rhizobium sp. CFBP 13726]MBD8653967.1 hydantoinase/carbamoylase family amidase [Rhizobium sp. CFBP 13726]